jgi:hypothetical protein
MQDRMQAIVIPIVHKNQYDFIKSRSTIQYYLVWAFEYIHQCQQSKKELVILKLDFAKAFDMVEHSAITLMMKIFGFLQQWIHWVTTTIDIVTTLVFLNEVLGKSPHYRRGIR